MIASCGGAGDQVFESNGVKLFVDLPSASATSRARKWISSTRSPAAAFTIKNPNAVHVRVRVIVQRLSPPWRPPSRTSPVKPSGGKRSSKREQSSTCSRQEGTSAPTTSISSAVRTIVSAAPLYRTLQWMVDAGIARKVDFGEGRFRFEYPTASRGIFT